MRKSHCLLYVARGEGYGVAPREAMATGLPVILPKFATLEEIATDEISFPLNWNYVKAEGFSNVVITWNNKSSELGDWVNIGLDDLQMKMKMAAENPLETLRKGRLAAKLVREKEGISHTAHLLKKHFDVARICI